MVQREWLLALRAIVLLSHFHVIVHPHPGVVAEDPVPPESATSNGYTQSKWVVERMLLVAREYTPLPAVSVRIGQITGGKSGAWNTTEWFPAMLKSSQHLGCLPNFDKVGVCLMHGS